MSDEEGEKRLEAAPKGAMESPHHPGMAGN
jgi:hypothetical protein